MAIRRNRRVWIWLLGSSLALAVLVGLAVPAISPNVSQQTEWSFCERCGARKVVTQVKVLGTSELLDSESQVVPTDLSAWCEAHYPSPCEHFWRLNHTGTTGYFVLGPFRIQAGGTSAGSWPTPSLLSLDEQERKELDERYAAGKAACREYIAGALK